MLNRRVLTRALLMFGIGALCLMALVFRNVALKHHERAMRSERGANNVADDAALLPEYFETAAAAAAAPFATSDDSDEPIAHEDRYDGQANLLAAVRGSRGDAAGGDDTDEARKKARQARTYERKARIKKREFEAQRKAGDRDQLRNEDIIAEAASRLDVAPGDADVIELARQLYERGLIDRREGRVSDAADTVAGVWRLVLQDPLTSRNFVAGAREKKEKSGEFALDGWRSTARESQLVIELDTAFGPHDGGAVEVDVTGLDPAAQLAPGSGEKTNILALHSRSDGARSGWTDPRAWLACRVGREYVSDKSGAAGVKLHAAGAGIKSMSEVRYSERRWRADETHTLRIEFTRSSARLLLDGAPLQAASADAAARQRAQTLRAAVGALESEPAGDAVAFHSRVEPLTHIFVGKDNQGPGFAGPRFSNLRVWRKQRGLHVLGADDNNDDDDEPPLQRVPPPDDPAGIPLAALDRWSHDELLTKLRLMVPQDEMAFGRAHFMLKTGNMPGKFNTKYPILPEHQVAGKLKATLSGIDTLEQQLLDFRARLPHTDTAAPVRALLDEWHARYEPTNEDDGLSDASSGAFLDEEEEEEQEEDTNDHLLDEPIYEPGARTDKQVVQQQQQQHPSPAEEPKGPQPVDQQQGEGPKGQARRQPEGAQEPLAAGPKGPKGAAHADPDQPRPYQPLDQQHSLGDTSRVEIFSNGVGQLLPKAKKAKKHKKQKNAGGKSPAAGDAPDPLWYKDGTGKATAQPLGATQLVDSAAPVRAGAVPAGAVRIVALNVADVGPSSNETSADAAQRITRVVRWLAEQHADAVVLWGLGAEGVGVRHVIAANAERVGEVVDDDGEAEANASWLPADLRAVAQLWGHSNAKRFGTATGLGVGVTSRFAMDVLGKAGKLPAYGEPDGQRFQSPSTKMAHGAFALRLTPPGARPFGLVAMALNGDSGAARRNEALALTELYDQLFDNATLPVALVGGLEALARADSAWYEQLGTIEALRDASLKDKRGLVNSDLGMLYDTHDILAGLFVDACARGQRGLEHTLPTALPDPSVPAQFGALRLDYALVDAVSADTAVLQCQVVRDPVTARLSTRFPLRLDLQLEALRSK